MIIVSQDKKTIVNFKQICVLGINKDNPNEIGLKTTRDIDDNGIIVGKYSTQERAKEVLQEIIESYKHGKTNCMIGENEMQENENVYEMPED